MKSFLRTENPNSKYFNTLQELRFLDSKVSLLLWSNNSNSLKIFALFESIILDFSFLIERNKKSAPAKLFGLNQRRESWQLLPSSASVSDNRKKQQR